MSKDVTFRMVTFLILIVAALTAGCATMSERKVDILYPRIESAKGTLKDLYFVEEAAPNIAGTTSIQWILGKITNRDGENVGTVVSDIAPADLVTEAFTQEFKGVGYTMIRGSSLPQDVVNGLKLESVTIKLDEVESPLNIDVSCKVKITVEPWKNGKATNRLEYEADYSDSAIINREELLSKIMLRALRTIMARSIPDIVRNYEQN